MMLDVRCVGAHTNSHWDLMRPFEAHHVIARVAQVYFCQQVIRENCYTRLRMGLEWKWVEVVSTHRVFFGTHLLCNNSNEIPTEACTDLMCFFPFSCVFLFQRHSKLFAVGETNKCECISFMPSVGYHYNVWVHLSVTSLKCITSGDFLALALWYMGDRKKTHRREKNMELNK